jgi:hypothetical protein
MNGAPEVLPFQERTTVECGAEELVVSQEASREELAGANEIIYT